MTFAGLLAVSLVASLPAQAHWSLVPPQRSAVPAVHDAAWPVNDFDRFVLAALEARGMPPAPPADAATWLRRVSLDLVGLPPTLADLDAFLADDRPDARHRVVERLLASPHYGERWARPWLDLARYADTNGYEKDRARSMWPWRDWVIDALNQDLPFDRFTIEQLAGDMLPQPTLAQRVATGFHRNSMINEEGGIDVEEFRYAAVVDRVNTTATTWLGLTVGCAQCHDHKYDPITQRDYFALLAVFDNSDEVVLPLDDAEIAAKRATGQAAIAARRADLAAHFPLPMPSAFVSLTPAYARAEHGTELAIGADASVSAHGPAPAREVYTLEGTLPAGTLTAVQLEVLLDALDPARGPGRTSHGNFVLSEFEVSIAGAPPEPESDPAAQNNAADGWTRLPLEGAEADFAQKGYPVAAAIDGDADTGWGIHGPGDDWRRDHHARFVLRTPRVLTNPTSVRIVLRQNWGSKHTLARFRVGFAVTEGTVDVAAQRRAHLEERFAQWLIAERRHARPWRITVPTSMHSAGGADFLVRDDASIVAYGNNPDRDTTVLRLAPTSSPVAAVRIEALPDPSLPAGGPGRSPFYPDGGFTISDARARVVASDGTAREVHFARAVASYEHGEHPAAHAIDAAPDTGWTNEGNVGRRQHIVLAFTAPLSLAPGELLELTLAQHSIHNNNLGRFRLAVLDDAAPSAACSVANEVEVLLTRGAAVAPADLAAIRQAFLDSSPWLARAYADLTAMEQDLPPLPTTMVVRERESVRARQTPLRQRGEFTRPRAIVAPGVPACLPPLPPGEPTNRLTVARWLVSGTHPLTARVAVNRAFAAFFGHGLVTTLEDFGKRGAPPTHAALLDWLACEYVADGWSTKRLHRLMVTSATYAQATTVSEASAAEDLDNRWFARMSRVRLPAELLRDQALGASGLLVATIGGPSVFPPQPKGVADVAYGKAAWKVSTGDDRYRRGLYTFSKRTAPYAMYTLFDAPSGESCVAVRGRTNTPLQALTLLNDEVFVEAARALAREVCAATGDDALRLRTAFRRCVARTPTAGEEGLLLAFLARQRARLALGELDARRLLGMPTPADHVADAAADTDDSTLIDWAAWTALGRVLLNLDEMIVRG